jgi:hypothetical protein
LLKLRLVEKLAVPTCTRSGTFNEASRLTDSVLRREASMRDDE